MFFKLTNWRLPTLLIAGLFIELTPLTGQAQSNPQPVTPLKKHTRYTLGVKVEGNQLKMNVDQTVANKYHVYSSSEQFQGYRLGVFGRRDFKKSYLQAELTYFYNTVQIGFINLKPDEDTINPYGKIGRVWTQYGPIYIYRRAEFSLVAGKKLFKRLRVQAGAPLHYQFYDRDMWKPDSYFENVYQYSDKISSDFAASYRRFFLSGRAGVGIDFGPLTIDVGYEQSFTPLSSRITHRGQTYPLKQTASVWSIGLGYKIHKF